MLAEAQERLELPRSGRLLHAGPLTVELDAPVLRYVRLGGLEVVRRIYPAVRDAAWGTVPAVLSRCAVTEGPDRFGVELEAEHRRGELDLAWRGTITGSPGGTLSYELAGEARRPFAYNRIGLCVAHPAAQAGAPFTAALGDAVRSGTLPELVAPQEWRGGVVLPAVAPFERLRLTVEPGLEVAFALEGDEFELEDQRNWADGSFKTYSTPLARGWPHHAEAGRRFHQRVTVEVVDRRRARPRPRPAGAPVRIAVGPAVREALPPIGLLAEGEADPDALAPLRVAHLRVDTGPEGEGLADAAACARALGAALEVALHLPQGAAPPALPEGVALARAIVIRPGFDVAGGEIAPALRPHLAGAPLLTGTDGNFAELNRTRPALDGLDGVAFPVTPTFHDTDGASIVEGIAAIGDVVRSAAALAGARAVAVSPLTLRPRANLFAPSWTPDDATDPRQATPFAAAWLVGALAAAAQAGAASVTAFALSGPRGVRDGAPYPVFHVLAELAARRDAPVLRAACDDPLGAAALALGDPRGVALLVANLRPSPLEVAPPGPLAGPVRRLSAVPAGACGLAGAPGEALPRRAPLRIAPFDVVLLTLEETE